MQTHLDTKVQQAQTEEAKEQHQTNAEHMKNQRTRAQKLKFFSACSSIQNFPSSDIVYFLHPIRAIGEMGSGCIKNCGKEFNGKIQCTRYGNIYGPIYRGNESLENYQYWDELIANNKITLEEKMILIGMSSNEGNLDAVQSYDSEVLSVGMIQKTVNTEGKGEFSKQVQEFQKSHPHKYQCLFEKCGWTVENNTIYYKDPDNINAEKITGTELKAKIREGFTETNFGTYTTRCKPLEAIINATKDKDFQAKQIEDFIKRLHKVLAIKPIGYTYTLNDYLHSRLGKATVLDHHVNRPSFVDDDFGAALNRFYVKYPTADRNPSNWADNHSDYEKEILNDYGCARRGTNMSNRYEDLKERL
jgi:hypothetical protein